MISYNKADKHKKHIHKGRGVVNSIISKLPFELHLPGYQYCGPGTKLQKRLARGDPGINELDVACKEHDIAYSNNKDTLERNRADTILAEKAWQRVKSKDASLGEKASALLVTNIMKAKAKFGMGVKPKKKKKMCRKNNNKNENLFHKTLRKTREAIMKKKPFGVEEAAKMGYNVAKRIMKDDKDSIQLPRVIPIPKTGGVLPFLIPLFAGLSAAGALSGGAASIVSAVNKASNAKKQLAEAQRHNQTMEAVALGKGLHLKPYRTGFGLFLNPPTKNF